MAPGGSVQVVEKAFVFTDIVGSTQLKQLMAGRTGSERDHRFARDVLAPHRDRLLARLAQYGGELVSTAGDGHFLAFSSSINAVMWAIEVQQDLEAQPIEVGDSQTLGLKIGIHRGQASRDPSEPGNYVGKNVDWAARLEALGTRGKILVSKAVAEAVRDEQIFGVELYDHGVFELRGIGDKPVLEVLYPGQQPGPIKGTAKPQEPAAASLTPAAPSPSLDLAPTTPLLTRPTVGALLKGCYRLDEAIGGGGMGTVYRATHVELHVPRAVKVINESLLGPGNLGAIERFYREVRLAGQLDHPNVVRAYDSSSRSDPLHFLVMEYVDGVSLERVVQGQKLSAAHACEVVRQAALGLGSIHAHGMVHRDIKPSNLMLTFRGGQPLVKILDLGLAVLLVDPGGRLTEVDKRGLGTAYYMAPEQWRSSQVDARADIYSLGCTFYQLLTGRPPFDRSRYTQEYAHCNLEPPALDAIEGLPKEVQTILRKMVAKSPAERFATAADVAAAVAPFANAAGMEQLVEPTFVGPADSGTPTKPDWQDDLSTPRANDSGGRRRWRPSRRAVLALAALGAAAVGMGGWWLASRRAAARKLAADIVMLPGLNGDWWFDETPWLTPVVRRAIAGALSGDAPLSLDVDASALAEALASPNPDVPYSQLREAARQASSLLTEAQREVLSLLESDEISAAGLEESQRLASQIAEGPLASAEDIHLAAVLEQQLAPAKFTAERIEKSFKRALDRYRHEGPSGEAACQADFGLWLAGRRRSEAAEKSFNVVLAAGPPAARIAALVAVASIHREQGAWSNATAVLNEARRAADDALAGLHPLSALVIERQAWTAMDQWHVEEARSLFCEAIVLRRKLAEKLVDPPQTESAVRLAKVRNEIGLLHDDHGQAMTLRYSGNVSAAQAAYEKLRDEAIPQRQRAHASDPRYVREKFHERLINTLERLGDTWLYRVDRPAAKQFERACDLWEMALEDSGKLLGVQPALEARLHAKTALARALAGDRTAARAAIDAAKLARKLLSVEKLTERFLAFAGRLLARPGEGASTLEHRNWRHRLREELNTAQTGRHAARLHRDERDLLLLVHRQLLADGLAGDGSDGDEMLKRDIDAMSLVLPDNTDRAVLRFLRPHFQLLVEAELARAEKNRLRRAAGWMQRAKTGELFHPPAQAALVIYLAEERGWAVLVSPSESLDWELRTGTRVLRGTDAQAAKRRLWQELESPLRASPRPLAVYWDDLGIDPPLLAEDFPVPLGELPADVQLRHAPAGAQRSPPATADCPPT
jgi:serine/threonine protein kinase/class 3 adenylate cyclase